MKSSMTQLDIPHGAASAMTHAMPGDDDPAIKPRNPHNV